MVTERIRRDDCRVVLLRNQLQGSERFGKWEPISRGGWVVICPTRVEALSLLLYVGSRAFGVPSNVAVDDPRYAEWLQHHNRMRIERYRATGKGEVLFAEFIDGWVPTPEERTQGKASHLLEDDDDYLRIMRPSKFAPLITGAIRQAISS